MGSSFIPSLQRPDQQNYVSPPVSCVWNSSLTNEPLKLKALHCFVSSPNTNPATLRHIPEDLILNRTYVETPNLTLYTLRCSINNHLQFMQRSTNFPKILVAIPKFYAPEVWHKASSKLMTHNSGVTCGPYFYMVLCAQYMWTDPHFCTQGEVGWGEKIESEREEAKIMLHIYGATISNLVVWATWPLGWLHPRIFVYTVQLSRFIHMKNTQLITQHNKNVTLLLTYIYFDLEWEWGDFRLFAFLWLLDVTELRLLLLLRFWPFLLLLSEWFLSWFLWAELWLLFRFESPFTLCVGGSGDSDHRHWSLSSIFLQRMWKQMFMKTKWQIRIFKSSGMGYCASGWVVLEILKNQVRNHSSNIIITSQKTRLLSKTAVRIANLTKYYVLVVKAFYWIENMNMESFCSTKAINWDVRPHTKRMFTTSKFTNIGK